MYGLSSSYETFSLNDLYSFDGIPDLPPFSPPILSVVEDEVDSLAEINSLAVKNLSQKPLKRKREEEQVLSPLPLKRKQKEPVLSTTPRLENLEVRIKKFEKLTITQRIEILGKSSALIKKYYKGSHPEQVNKFISEINNQEHKLQLLTWIRCMRQRRSLIKRVLDMLSEDNRRFNSKIRSYMSISNDLPEKSKYLSRYVTDLLKKATRNDDHHQWERSAIDENIHKAHIATHNKARKEIQENFEKSDINKKTDILNNNLDRIVEISYSNINKNIRFSIEEIKETILKITLQDRLILLHWMLYYSGIETIQLINLLTKYNIKLDKHILNYTQKLIYRTEKKDIETLRQTLKRREELAIYKLTKSKSQSIGDTDIKDDDIRDDLETEPSTSPTLPNSAYTLNTQPATNPTLLNPIPFTYELYNPFMTSNPHNHAFINKFN